MRGNDDMEKTDKRLVALVIITVIFLVVLISMEELLNPIHWTNEYVHIAVELLGAFSGILISGLLFLDMKRWALDFSGIIIGFYMMGILDLFHSISAPGQSFVFLHSMASLFGALGILIFTITNKYKIKLNVTKITMFMITIISVIVGVVSMVFESKLPLMVVNGEFTFLATMINMIGGILFLLGAWIFYSFLRKTDNKVMLLFFITTFWLGVSGVSFQFSGLWHTSWWLWHFLRLIAQLALISLIVIVSEEDRKVTTRQNIEINDINQKLNNYTYTISHDLKEPIRSIRTFSEFILEDYGSQFDETASDYFNRIIVASNKMANMVDDLLVLSRVGKENIEFEEVMLVNILNKTLEDLELLITESQVIIEYTELPIVVCQPVWMKVVLSNLISNSIKYRDETKDVSNILIKYKEHKRYYEIIVSDNGIGIDQDQHIKIFGLFRRAYSKKNKSGSGAGLAIVEAIIKQHGGKVWIDQSALGIGTTINFTIEKRG